MMRKPFITLLGAALILCAGTLSAEKTAPELVVGKLPAYSKEARTHGVEGTVVVEALVDENGKVFAAEVVESADGELSAMTIAAVQDWQFKPAMEDGKPVMQVVRIPINFSLIDPMQETILRAHDRAIAGK